jgi:nucleotide-binding universal stress UspA family protein
MYDEILLPYDGSEGATAVLEHASEIARWADATLHVLFVADTMRDSVTVVDGEVVDALVQEGEDIVAEATEVLDSRGVSYDTDIVQGDPAETIAEYAERYEYDLIVMPTHGREGISRYLIGSVTEKVVHLSSVPVLTARLQPDEQLAFPYENILVPTDGSHSASRAVDHGLSLAATLDAAVHVLSVVDDTALGPDVRSLISEQERELTATEAIESVVSTATERGVTHSTHVEHGNPVETILDYVESTDVDAVVMGATGRTATERILLGSVAEKVFRSAPVPVITVGRQE